MNLQIVPRYKVFARLPFVLAEEQVRQATHALVGLANTVHKGPSADDVNRYRWTVEKTVDWLRERDAVVENVTLTRSQTRTVEEVVLHLLADDVRRIELPVAIVTDRTQERSRKG